MHLIPNQFLVLMNANDIKIDRNPEHENIYGKSTTRMIQTGNLMLLVHDNQFIQIVEEIMEGSIYSIMLIFLGNSNFWSASIWNYRSLYTLQEKSWNVKLV